VGHYVFNWVREMPKEEEEGGRRLELVGAWWSSERACSGDPMPPTSWLLEEIATHFTE
jgi:hypothetical protein